MKSTKPAKKRPALKKPKSDNLEVINKTLSRLKTKTTIQQLQKSNSFVFIGINKDKFEIPSSYLKDIISMLQNRIKPAEENFLTTQQVADLLNVSRPFVVKLIDSGLLKGHKTGSKRRVLMQVALDYRAKMRNEQSSALDDLTKESEDLGLDF